MTPESLTAWRERLGFNRAEAARRLGMSRTTYLEYEEGKPNKRGEPKKIPLYIALACAAIAHGLPPMGGGPEEPERKPGSMLANFRAFDKARAKRIKEG